MQWALKDAEGNFVKGPLSGEVRVYDTHLKAEVWALELREDHGIMTEVVEYEEGD